MLIQALKRASDLDRDIINAAVTGRVGVVNSFNG